MERFILKTRKANIKEEFAQIDETTSFAQKIRDFSTLYVGSMVAGMMEGFGTYTGFTKDIGQNHNNPLYSIVLMVGAAVILGYSMVENKRNMNEIQDLRKSKVLRIVRTTKEQDPESNFSKKTIHNAIDAKRFAKNLFGVLSDNVVSFLGGTVLGGAIPYVLQNGGNPLENLGALVGIGAGLLSLILSHGSIGKRTSNMLIDYENLEDEMRAK